ncbi:MAG TPA: hypothetical protein PKI82_13900, partial [Ruminococcus flavefaciens]|nr:hypothetical protein [Ruminococcus flavefaciens]
KLIWCAPYMGAKLIVLGNEFEKILLQNVYLNNTYKTSLSVPPLSAPFKVISKNLRASGTRPYIS